MRKTKVFAVFSLWDNYTREKRIRLPDKRYIVTGKYFFQDDEIYTQVIIISIFGYVKSKLFYADKHFTFFERTYFNCEDDI